MPPNSPAKTPVLVFDSWALLAWLRDEAAADRVRAILQQAEDGGVSVLMSWINAGEVYYMLRRKHDGKVAEQFLDGLPSLPIHLRLPGEDDVLAAARLKATRRISYADAFAAALARREAATLVTGDPELREMLDVLQVEWIGAGA